MISILKSKKNSSDLEKCSKIEKNTWINLVKPSEEEIKNILERRILSSVSSKSPFYADGSARLPMPAAWPAQAGA